MATKTIAKNRAAKITEVFEKGQGFTCYDLDTYFNGVPVSGDWVKRELMRFSFAKLQDYGNGKYHVTLHSNCWYTFTVPSG